MSIEQLGASNGRLTNSPRCGDVIALSQESSYGTLCRIVLSNQEAAYWYNNIHSACYLYVVHQSYSIERARCALPPGFRDNSLEGEVDFFTEVPMYSLHGGILLQGITAQFATCQKKHECVRQICLAVTQRPPADSAGYNGGAAQ